MSTEKTSKSWSFLTNHTQVLLCIARDPETRLRDIAETVGITERAVQRIVADLIESDFVTRERVGRRSRYRLNREARMRHPAQYEHEIGEMLDLLELDEPGKAYGPGAPGRIRTCDPRIRSPPLCPLSYGRVGEERSTRATLHLARWP
jgi:DNA-binding MarR family transcriptional regulator